MHLARFPRRRYTNGWTPLEKMGRLSTLLGGPDLYIKRDDLLGLAAGGNKTRKLEFLVADAIARGADTLITCGAVQSNHARLTLAAAAREGLKCRLVLEERVPGSYNDDAGGNNFLYQLLGVEAITVVPGGSDMIGGDAEGGGRGGRARAEGVRDSGRRVQPAGRAGLRGVRRGDPGSDVRPRHPPRSHRVRQRQRRHAGGARGRARREQQQPAADRHQRQSQPAGTGAEGAQAGRGDRGCPRCNRRHSRARRLRAWATGSAPVTRCRPPG